ncbi:MAG: cation:proton antiporter [Ferruginibacter sp.]
MNAYSYILAVCGLVMISYLYNLLSGKTGIPAVLLLLVTGICCRELLLYTGTEFHIPHKMLEIFGVLGLIMIILEAGLDLEADRKKLPLVRHAFFSALCIFLLSAIACASLLHLYLGENFMNCLVYAIPLSVVSSAIVIPSISHLGAEKKEFLVYETSFSDIVGILLFNYIIAGEVMKWQNIAWFFGSVLFSVIISVVLSFFMLLLLLKITTRVRFFLVLAVLVFLYAGGKLLHLPALFIILLFGLITANWQLPLFKRFYQWIRPAQVSEVKHMLHALTAESSFLVRTFFFFVFGLTIDLRLLCDAEVLLAGTALVTVLFGVRYIYLRFFLKTHIMPALFFMPRGLITILLFYSIPDTFKLSAFNEGILFFVILVTSIIMMVGSVVTRKQGVQVINDEVPLT